MKLFCFKKYKSQKTFADIIKVEEESLDGNEFLGINKNNPKPFEEEDTLKQDPCLDNGPESIGNTRKKSNQYGSS